MSCIYCNKESQEVEEYCHACGQEPICFDCLKDEWCPACCIKSCPNCEATASYFPEDDNQAAAIYCDTCPLGVEKAGASFVELATTWNSLARKQCLQ